MLTHTSVKTVPILIGGSWQASSSNSSVKVLNPSSGQVIAQTPLCGREETETVVAAAAEALNAWSDTPVVERARVMFKFRELVEHNFEELAALITREHGKTLSEARAEVQRGLEMIEFACGIPSLLMGDTLSNIAAGVDAETIRHPIGVCVGINAKIIVR